MKAYERLLKYVVVRTPSDEESGKSPSSECQFKLAGLLKDEMTELGLSDVKLDKHCYLYGRLPATKGLEKLPSIGFIAHMDTSPDMSGKDVTPRIVENYNGSEIVLDAEERVVPVSYTHLTLPTSDLV